MKRQLLASLSFVVVCVVSGAAKEWCSIVPLHSTRADLEREIKAKPNRCNGNACIYDLPDKTIFALYAAEATCRNDDVTTSWNVPAGTVVQLTINFKTAQPFSALNIDVTKCDRTVDKELQNLFYLSDYLQGVRMEASGDTVRSITYYAAAKDDHLRCRKDK